MQTGRTGISVVGARKPRLRRVRLAAPLRLTGSQREVLALLHEYAFLTPRLLALAYGAREGRDGRGYWYLQRELRRLYDAGLVERFNGATRASQNGSTEAVYAITHEGGRAILDVEDYASERHELYNRESKQRANFEHHVAIATLQLVLTLGQQDWTLVDFRAEERDPQACIRVRVKDQVLTAWPDASAIIRPAGVTTGGDRRFLFEIDLTRKNNQRIEDRFRAYAGYLVSRRQATPPRTTAGTVSGAEEVVFTVVGESELERFLEIAGRVLSAWKPSERPVFAFWNMQDWYEGGGGSGHRVPADLGRPLAPGAVLRPVDDVLQTELVTVEGAARRLIEAKP